MGDAPFVSHWDGLDDLAPRALYALLKLRVDVFVVEQSCPYAEIDGRDVGAFHLRILKGGELAAALRVLPPEEGCDAVKIGRVVVAPAFRGDRLGRRLMREALAFAKARFPGRAVELGAQSYLRGFYASLKFKAISDEYLEDGIPHIDMRLEPQDNN